MSLKTKENKTQKINSKRTMILVILILLITIVVAISVINQRTVLDEVGKLFNVKETNKTGETQTVSTANWDLEKVNIVYDKDNVAVPVPKGYVASSVENGITPIGQEILEENRVRTGFVIYEMTVEEIENGTEVSITKDNFWEESQKRNQWVWVPVTDTSRIYERNRDTGKAKAKLWNFTTTGRTQQPESITLEPGVLTNKDYDNEKLFAMYNMQGMTEKKLLEELENEFEMTMKSIEKYGGFYIGRYETGNVANLNKKPAVQRMNTNIRDVAWYDAYNNMKNIQRNESIKSNIIWGSLWDETLQWLVDSGDKTYAEINNSVDWGNYYNSDFDYISLNGTAAHKNVESYGPILPTGSSENNKANNIYDIAGNVLEWTLEISGTRDGTNDRTLRGGYYSANSTSCPPYYRFGYGKSEFRYFLYGVRAYFYIK